MGEADESSHSNEWWDSALLLSHFMISADKTGAVLHKIMLRTALNLIDDICWRFPQWRIFYEEETVEHRQLDMNSYTVVALLLSDISVPWFTILYISFKRTRYERNMSAYTQLLQLCISQTKTHSLDVVIKVKYLISYR